MDFGGKYEPVERRCLKCNRRFQAEGRFNRLCPACALRNEKIHDFGASYRVLRQP
jgi:Zn finger protein HypA/HybF involved in hydrogenase expression